MSNEPRVPFESLDASDIVEGAEAILGDRNDFMCECGHTRRWHRHLEARMRNRVILRRLSPG
jgi:hypothetical protein